MAREGTERYEEIARRYKSQLNRDLSGEESKDKPVFSTEYQMFKKEFMPKNLSIYEKLCNWSEKVAGIKPDPKVAEKLQTQINICHLDITPTGATSFAYLAPVLVAFFGGLLGYGIPALFMKETTLFFVMFALLFAALLLIPLQKMPEYMANGWRMKASNQMVICIFYVVTYMRHTSNLELAVEFASQHLAPPLSLDLKKVLWDVETQKYDTVRDSLDAYLEGWRTDNPEFLESFHLIISSLFEGTEERRIAMLDKSLDVILEETYEKMLHFAHNIKSPISTLNMLGVVLPILGLVMLPLMVSFMPGIRWYHIFMVYNLFLPIIVYFYGKSILATRPTGYGSSDISETSSIVKEKEFKIKLGNSERAITPGTIAITLGIVLCLVGISPILIHLVMPDFDYGFTFSGADQDKFAKVSPCGQQFCLLEYRQGVEPSTVDSKIGPFGIGSAILSLLVTLALGLSMGIYFKLRSENVIEIRDKTKKLEQEFASALFQLGNRLGDHLPAEIAFGRVASVMEGTESGTFFAIVDNNIRRVGMSVPQAIFNSKNGAIAYFPSNMIESSMEVLVQSIKKGPSIAAQAVMNVSRYIKEIHLVNERLKDILEDVVSSMASQINFLTPIISGVVVGITSMITNILGLLTSQAKSLGSLTEGSSTGAGGIGSMAGSGLIGGGDGIPTFFFQIVVGIYVIQIIYILTMLMNGIDNGPDKISERYLLGRNLIRGTIFYCITTGIIMILFNLIAGTILSQTGGLGNF
jgi:hypothetical protein